MLRKAASSRLIVAALAPASMRQGFPFDVDAFLQELRDGTSAGNEG
jgi:hypothetical protein